MTGDRTKRVAVRMLSVVLAVGAAGSCTRREPSPETAPADPTGQGPPSSLTTSTGVEMVLVAGGEFTMGHGKEIDARPEHAVTVDSFYMDKFEVTQEAYEKVMGKNPSRTKGARNPVERVRWLEAITYCNALSKKDGLKPCYDLKARKCDSSGDGYRLPTEAEWEYACRAGTTGDFPFDGGVRRLDAHAWFKDNAADRTHPVGKKRPNGFGLHDMLGNVREWCNDWYDVRCYKKRAGKPVTDPTGPAKGEKKVLRGGAWSVSAKSCTAWARYCDEPGFTDACVVSDDCGFRCVRRPTDRDRR